VNKMDYEKCEELGVDFKMYTGISTPKYSAN
jgi:hypothetical protein